MSLGSDVGLMGKGSMRSTRRGVSNRVGFLGTVFDRVCRCSSDPVAVLLDNFFQPSISRESRQVAGHSLKLWCNAIFCLL